MPLGHRAPSDGGLFGPGELLPGQIELRRALDTLKPLLEAPGVLKIAHNMKYDWLVFAEHGIEVGSLRRHDAAILRARRRRDHATAMAWTGSRSGMLGHQPIAFKDLAGSGKAFIGFARVPLDKATEYAAEDADVALRLWRTLKPRLPAERMTTVYETLERPMVETLGRMERRGIAIDSAILSRLSGDFAQSMARLEAEIYEIAGEPFNLGSTKQLAEILFGKMGLPGARKTATGAWSTSAQVLDDLAEAGNAFRPAGAGMAAGLQAQVHLYGRAADLRGPAHGARPHLLRARLDHHGPARPRRTRTSRTSRSAPRPAARSAPRSLRRRATSWCRPIIRRSSFACSPISRTSRNSSRLSRRGATSMP